MLLSNCFDHGLQLLAWTAPIGLEEYKNEVGIAGGIHIVVPAFIRRWNDE
jgi:hypothetical protein